jgi:prolipoprotein diacylglyceryl transferase
MLLNQISWDVSPVIFSLGSLHIRWYGLFFALSFYLGYVILEKQVFKREGLPVGLLDRLATYVVIGTVVGARLGHVLFYEPASYLRDPISILKIWEGGLASHGAAIGILLALWIFKRKSGKSYLWTLDRLVIVVALGGFFIRMGNLMNSEIY